jgi:hypothetical protein
MGNRDDEYDYLFKGNNFTSTFQSGHNCTLAVPIFILPDFGNFLRSHLASSVKSVDFLFKRVIGEDAPRKVKGMLISN